MSRTTQKNYFLGTFSTDNVGLLESEKPWMNIDKSSAPLLPPFQQADGRSKCWLGVYLKIKIKVV